MSENGRPGPYLGPDDLSTTNQNGRPSRRGLPSLSKTCFIQPKTTGLASLFLQFGLLIVSGITTMFFFYHVGGYEYMQWNENSTILEPVHHSFMSSSYHVEESFLIEPEVEKKAKTTKPKFEDMDDSLVSTSNRSLEFINEKIEKNQLHKRQAGQVIESKIITSTENIEAAEHNDAFAQFIDNLLGNEKLPDNSTFGIEQVPMTSINIGGMEFDWLEVIRISTLVYLAICVIWFLTMVFFIFTIRCEILDTVIVNLVTLGLVIIYQFAHSFLIGALLFFQTEMSWRTMAITIGSIIILSCCSFLGCVCFVLNCGWVKYIDYMHTKRKCICLAMVIRLIKGKKSREGQSNEYTMADRNYTTNNGNTYENDVPIQQFSAF